jgi:plasmid stabilization system protein ParE
LSYHVRFTPEAEADLLQLYDFLAAHDPKAAGAALRALRKALELLRLFPFACRKAEGGNSPLLRELLVTFGSSGYVALFEIDGPKTVTVVAVRHQRESDFH